MKHTNSLDIPKNVFTLRSAKRIAMSLKRSAERSVWRHAPAFRSAMSMLNFYINRAGKNLTSNRKLILDRAKVELRVLYRKPRTGLRMMH
jgi:Protein of unknown function (DUF3175)